MSSCGLCKPALGRTRCPEVLLTITAALGDKVHRLGILKQHGRVLFLAVVHVLGLPRVLSVVPKGGVVV
jgi:hypothetical protein